MHLINLEGGFSPLSPDPGIPWKYWDPQPFKVCPLSWIQKIYRQLYTYCNQHLNFQLAVYILLILQTVGIPDYDCDLDAEEPDDSKLSAYLNYFW